MEPITMAMIGASALSVFGQISAGVAQREASKLNAFQIKTDQALNKTQAMQMSRARKEEYDLATSANIAAFAAAGRDVGSDRSVQAFLDRQKEIIAQDTGRIDQQIQFQNMKSKSAAMAERRRGDNALTASLFSAVGTASQGIYQYQTVKAPAAPSGGGGGK
jgi:hypothetical protein